MKKNYNPFKLLYRKFGLKKIIITLVSIICILLPSILAIFLHIDSNKMIEKNASDSLTVILYDKNGDELYRDQGKSENYSEDSLVGIFNVMKKNLVQTSKIPVGIDTSTPILAKMISNNSEESYTYYFSFAEGGSFCEYNGNTYKVQTSDSERFLASPFAEPLYASAIPPALNTADGDVVTPVYTSWKYKNLDNLFITATNIPTTSDVVTYHVTAGISIDFDKAPDKCVVKIFDDDTPIFSGNLNSASKLTLDSNTPLSVKIDAEWYKSEDCDSYGAISYNFYIIIHSRAEFSISADSIQKNGFTVLKATNITDISKLSFSSEQIQTVPKFNLIGETAYAVIPCISSDKEIAFTVSYGVSTKTFSVFTDKTSAIENSLIANSANALGFSPSSISANFECPIFFFGTRISPADNGFVLKSFFGENEYAYKNTYEFLSGSGASVNAICGGKVSKIGESSLLGNYAVIDVGLGLSLIYSNLSSLDVSEGDFMAAGGIVGKTGYVSNSTEGFSLILIFDGTILDPNVLF